MYNERCFTTNTVLSDVKLIFLEVTNVLKLRSIRYAYDFPALVFLFMNILVDNLLMQFLYIQKSKTNTFLAFFPLLGTASSPNTFYMSLRSTKNFENINHPWLFKRGKWNSRHSVY